MIKGNVKNPQSSAIDHLRDILTLAGSPRAEAEKITDDVITRFGSPEVISVLSTEELCRMLGERAAVLVKLEAYIASRRVTDSFSFGTLHTDREIYELAIATFLGLSKETVYIIAFDSEDRVIALDFVCEGTVNHSEVYPRLLVEAALRRNAYSVILAHNHPLGTSEPSDADLVSTQRLYDVLCASGIRMRSHIIVAEYSCSVMKPCESYGIDGAYTLEYYDCKGIEDTQRGK